MSTPRVIFAGTPEFSVAALQALVENDIVPVAVLTQPDRPAGRGRRVTASPVKQYALEQGIAVMQPPTLRDEAVVAELGALQPDIMIVAAYGLILPQNVLDIPPAGCLNVHASMLPRWRGAAPIQAAILAGDEQTGVCLMSMTAGLDCGPVYAGEVVKIGADETAGQLHDRLAVKGGRLLVKYVADIIDRELDAEEQNEDEATYAPKIRNSDAVLDWRKPAAELARAVRAYNPVPGAWFILDDERIKCWGAAETTGNEAPPGTVLAAGAEGIVVACGGGAVRMDSLQRPGKRPITAAEFAAQVDLIGRRL
jgi:methionyl-tRNA formyltransferase